MKEDKQLRWSDIFKYDHWPPEVLKQYDELQKRHDELGRWFQDGIDDLKSSKQKCTGKPNAK